MKERGRRQGVKRKDGGERKNSEGRTVLIPRESGGTAEAPRFARTGHANLVRAAACLEAGKRAPLAVRPFINKINSLLLYIKKSKN